MSFNLNNVSLRISAGFPSQFPTDCIPQIAFSGRSNVGKSSLINLLLGRKSLARVSSTPGKTITINFYDIDQRLFFVDLPGYGFAKRKETDKIVWSDLTDGYFTKNPNIDLLRCVIQLVDSRIGATEDDRMMIRFLQQSSIPFFIVATKMDKLNASEKAELFDKIRTSADISDDTLIVPVSALKSIGKEDVWQEIYRSVGWNL